MVDDVRPITLDEIRAARERIAGTITRTPLLKLELGPGFPDIRLGFNGFRAWTEPEDAPESPLRLRLGTAASRALSRRAVGGRITRATEVARPGDERPDFPG